MLRSERMATAPQRVFHISYHRVYPVECRMRVMGNQETKFAEDVIPTLPEESFETFRPMFDWIRAQCA